MIQQYHSWEVVAQKHIAGKAYDQKDNIFCLFYDTQMLLLTLCSEITPVGSCMGVHIECQGLSPGWFHTRQVFY